MSTVTFIIGNGFDLGIGLKTSYKNFLDVYKEPKKDDSEIVKWFKTEILEPDSANWENWADFEWQMGQESSKFTGKNCVTDFNECIHNFTIAFNAYLCEICESIRWDGDLFYKCFDSFLSSIHHFERYIKSSDGMQIEELIGEQVNINFLQFNYTSVFDELLNITKNYMDFEYVRTFSYGHNIHIHGKIDEYITIGVDNVEQIVNEKIRKNPIARNFLVKTENIATVQAEDANQIDYRKLAIEIIAESTVICVFGSSIGETDKSWWVAIGEWLKTATGKLIIFDISGANKRKVSTLYLIENKIILDGRKKSILEKFANVSDLGMDWVKNNPDRIIIELDTEMFKFHVVPQVVNMM
ncbi:MAG: bacteriophage abortive infection AbiH family protein [Turicibacter sp.]|nr:bacteriophage abortive infection AbiH family protein [Turicibacter sp.]